MKDIVYSKIPTRYLFFRKDLVKLFLIVFIFGSSISTYAIDADTSEIKLSIEVRQRKLVEVLDQIEDETGYYFVYNEKLVNVERMVNVSVKDKPIDKVLDDVFKGTQVGYQIVDGKIVLSPIDEAEQNTQQKEKVIKGTIVDESGLPIPGASIVVQGTTVGTISNMDGKYTLKVPANSSNVIISFLGMKQQVISLNNQTVIDVSMYADTEDIDEVVIVGFGAQKSSTVVSSVAQVSTEELNVNQRPVTNGASALVGAIPGLVASNTSGSPGSTPQLSIRGTSTLDGDASMLVIIDNFEGDLADIDPQTIQSVSVLKDASAVAIYGARGANGVLLVTTKRTERDENISVNYNFSTSIQTKPQLPTTLNSLDYFNFQNDIVPDTWGQDVIDLATSGFYPDTNWADELYENTAAQQSHNLTLTGGSGKTGYLLSASYLDQKGLAVGDDYYKRYNLRLKVDSDVSGWLTVGANALVSNSERETVTTISAVGIRGMPYFPVVTEDGLWANNGTSNSTTNAVATAASGSFNNNNKDKINIQLYAKAKLFKGLSFEERVSVIKSNALVRNWYNVYDMVLLDPTDPDSYTNPDSANRTYFYGDDSARSLSLTSSTSAKIRTLSSLTYDYKTNKHSFKVFAAAQTETGESESFKTGRSGFPYDDVISMDQGDIIDTSIGSLGNTETRGGNEATLSYFGRFNYSYADKYLLEASFRADASSYFTDSNKWGYFPSVAVGWLMSQENFLKNVDFVNVLKLRASYGNAGSDGSLGSVTQQLVGYSSASYPLGGQNTSGIYIDNFVNPDLIWETSTIFNTGLDASLFKGKLQFEYDYFINHRKDIIAYIEGTAFEYGFGEAQGNPYSVKSWGHEFNITHKNMIGKVGYNVSANLSYYDNEITHITEDAIDPDFMVGQSVNDRFGYQVDGFFDSDQELNNNYALDGITLIDQDAVGGAYVGGYKYVDQLTVDTDGDGVMDAGDGIINSDDRVIIDDNSDQNWLFGFNLGVSYENLSLSARFYGTFDNNQYWNSSSVTQPFLGNSVPFTYQTDVWSETNTDAMFPTPLDLSNQNYATNIDHLIVNAEYIKLQNITLNYNFGDRVLNKISFIKDLSMYVSVENLGVIWTNSPVQDEGWDPELGISGVQYPMPLTYAFGLNVKF